MLRTALCYRVCVHMLGQRSCSFYEATDLFWEHATQSIFFGEYVGHKIWKYPARVLWWDIRNEALSDQGFVLCILLVLFHSSLHVSTFLSQSSIRHFSISPATCSDITWCRMSSSARALADLHYSVVRCCFVFMRPCMVLCSPSQGYSSPYWAIPVLMFWITCN